MPTGQGKRHEPFIRDKGVPVSALVHSHRGGATVDDLVDMWGGLLTKKDVKTALAFFSQHPELFMKLDLLDENDESES